MADFAPAIAIVLRHEGGFAKKDAGKAGCVNRGLTQRFLFNLHLAPTWEAAYDFCANLTEPETVALYKKYFWDQYHVGELRSQQQANILFSMLVNMRVSAAVRTLQMALTDLGADIEVDGILGPLTMAAANHYPWSAVAPLWRDNLEAHYQNIAPSVGMQYLDGWLRRLTELFAPEAVT